MAVAVKKEAPKKEEKVPTELKYRYQFKSWAEYYKYKGPKG